MHKHTRSSRSVVVVAVVLGLLAAACSSTNLVSDTTASNQQDTATESIESDSPGNDTIEEATTVPDPVIEEVTTAPDPVTEEDLARFLAATEAALVGTSAEGLILAAPEIYIAIGQASCARFTQGDRFEQIVSDHLDDTDITPVADDAQLIGAILGAAVETICPEHRAKV